jgi:hypothetical protein
MARFSTVIALKTIAILDESAQKLVGCLFGLEG